jgi:hypothetical protein
MCPLRTSPKLIVGTLARSTPPLAISGPPLCHILYHARAYVILPPMSELNAIVSGFAAQLSSLIEKEATERARTVVIAAFGGPQRRGPGRPPKLAMRTAVMAPLPSGLKKARKKPPLQLCPVPGCKNPAAPVFGMVCKKHKDLPKAVIKEYREARKAKKVAPRRPKPGKRRAKN